MTPLRQALRDYLRIRRQLGYGLTEDGRLLETFVDFLERAGSSTITTELALTWAKLPAGARAHRWRQRLGIVRRFARYLATIDPDTEVPSKDLFRQLRAGRAVYLHRRGSRGADGRGARADAAAACSDIRDVDRADGRKRRADRRSARTGSPRTSTSAMGRFTFAPGRPSSARCRCTTRRPTRCERCRAPRPALARPQDASVLRPEPASARHRRSKRRSRSCDRAGLEGAASGSPRPHDSTHVCCAHTAGLAPRRSGYRHAAAAALHLSRASRSSATYWYCRRSRSSFGSSAAARRRFGEAP